MKMGPTQERRRIGNGSDPNNGAAGMANRLSQAVDVWNDFTGRRDFHLLAWRHEIVLHIHDNKRRLLCRNVLMSMPPALSTKCSVQHALRNLNFVHVSKPFQLSCCQKS